MITLRQLHVVEMVEEAKVSYQHFVTYISSFYADGQLLNSPSAFLDLLELVD